ncbi:MAG: peptidoglycan-binding protein [Clostridia bacterium]|nr:peptidoglycan-binding protein [Clostridia bacterium]
MRKMCQWIAVMLLLVLVCAPMDAMAARLSLSDMKAGSTSGSNTGSMISSRSIHTISGSYQRGDTGSAVLTIKERLQELGYYRQNAELENDFNDTMYYRVQLFQENNSMEVTGIVDSATLAKLRESNPIRGEFFKGRWNEPTVSLIVPENTTGKWRAKGEDTLMFNLKVKNISTSRTINAVEFAVYTKDWRGNSIISKSSPYLFTIENLLKPGIMGYAGYIEIPNRDRIAEVHVAINGVRYSDGSIEMVTTPQYYYWIIE